MINVKRNISVYEKAIRQPFVMTLNSKGAPRLLRWAVIFIVFGVTFPIYGTPNIMGIARLTFFRLGLIVLLISISSYHIKLHSVLSDRCIKLLVLLLAIRFLSLLISPAFKDGIQQLEWYFEGVICLIFLSSAICRWPALRDFLFTKIVQFGFVAALLMVFQFVLLNRGILWALPLSTTAWGRGNDPTNWYPLGVSYRILGPFFDANMSGSFMVLFICLILPLLLSTKKGRLKAAIIALIAFISINASGSRQSLVTLGIILLFNIIIIRHKRSLATLLLIALMTITISFALYSVSFRELMENRNPYEGNAITRLVNVFRTSSFLSGAGRGDYIKRLLHSIDWGSAILLGSGEGSGDWAAHNAYLIVLQENGLWATLCLLFFSLLMFAKTLKNAAISMKVRQPDYLAIAASSIVLAWIFLITMNWAQLNQSFPWVFLSLAFTSFKLNALRYARSNQPPNIQDIPHLNVQSEEGSSIKSLER